VGALKSKQDEVKQYAMQYWKQAKLANNLFEDYEKIKESEKHS
jgi:hypothetical protein